MFREKYRSYINWGVTVALILCAGIAFAFFILRWSSVMAGMKTLQAILAPVTTGMVIAYILESLVSTIVMLLTLIPMRKPPTMRRLRVYRVIAIVLSEMIFIAILSAMITTVVPQVIDSLRMLIGNYDTYITNLEAWVRPLLDEYPQIETYVIEQSQRIGEYVGQFLRTDLMQIVNVAANSVMGVGTYLYNFILGLIVSLYFLLSKENTIAKAKKLMFSILSVPRANSALETLRHSDKILRGFLVGKILDSLIVGVLCFIGCTIFGMPYTLLISILVGVTNIIPYFGPILGAVPSIFLILMVDPVKALIFAIFILVLQQLDGNVIGPKILGDTTGVSSLGVLLGILIGGGLFGFTGMILSVPVYAIIYRIIRAHAERRLEKRNLPTDLNYYVEVTNITPQDASEPRAALAPEPPKKAKKTK